eukprot:TRINITY_DN19404_c0_g1_i1.p1 TRINITY_DN19404_c0_g1~~TRINITY_DN19404_c0_g1_i1.p1  ORF type:complete len:401 (+),score=56.86 TRINITY_DN19404_c0_g1_i1:35-1204(+)
MRRGIAKCLTGFIAGAGLGTAASATAEELRSSYPVYSADDEYPDLSGSTHLMGGVLDRALWKANYHKMTHKGFTFNDAIQAGVDNQIAKPEDPGCVAGDEESFFVFKDLYNPIIRAKHGWNLDGEQTQDLNPDKIRGGNLDSKYVINVRVRASRNFLNHRFAPNIRRGEREEICWGVKHACSTMSSPFQGKWVELGKLCQKDVEEHVSEGLVAGKPTSPFLLSAGVGRDWPMGRAAHISRNKDLLVWANDSDHMKVIATQKGGNLLACYSRWCMAHIDLEAGLAGVGKRFANNRTLGYLGPSLSNLGTGMRVSVVAKLPLVSSHPGFNSFLTSRSLAKNPSPAGGSVEIYNTNRLGVTEVATVQNVIDAMEQLIAYEKVLASGKKIANL